MTVEIVSNPVEKSVVLASGGLIFDGVIPVQHNAVLRVHSEESVTTATPVNIRHDVIPVQHNAALRVYSEESVTTTTPVNIRQKADRKN